MSWTDPLERVLGPLEHPLRAADHALGDLERRAAAVEDHLHHAALGIGHAIEAASRPMARGLEHGLHDADAELVGAIRRTRVGTRGISDELMGLVGGIQARLTAMLEAVRYAAKVETRAADGRLVAISEIGWGGDSQNLMAPALDADTLGVHLRRLSVTIRHRRSRLKFVAVVVGGLVRVTAASASGGITALPALYRYVEQVLDAFDDLPAEPATTPGATP